MFNLGIKAKQINLLDKNERAKYSTLLQEMEKEFTYPLGDKQFSIQHGNYTNQDYFAFFEQMGQPIFFVFEHNNQIVGCFCAVFRKVGEQNVWYFCDYKIKKPYRGKNLYLKLVAKYLLKNYIKSDKMFAISMSPVFNNWLYNSHKSFFNFFKIRPKKLFLHSFTYGDYLRDKTKLHQYRLVSNSNKKDIIIDGKKQNILHLVNSANTYGFTTIDYYVDFPEDTPVMLLNEYPMPSIYNEKTQEVCLITNIDISFYISSAEV